MRAYTWQAQLHELESADLVAFRSWLLNEYTRDQAKRTLSCFHSMLIEMVTQGVLATDPATRVTIQRSRYKEPVEIPSIAEVQSILAAADRLANHKYKYIVPAVGALSRDDLPRVRFRLAPAGIPCSPDRQSSGKRNSGNAGGKPKQPYRSAEEPGCAALPAYRHGRAWHDPALYRAASRSESRRFGLPGRTRRPPAIWSFLQTLLAHPHEGSRVGAASGGRRRKRGCRISTRPIRSGTFMRRC